MELINKIKMDNLGKEVEIKPEFQYSIQKAPSKINDRRQIKTVETIPRRHM